LWKSAGVRCNLTRNESGDLTNTYTLTFGEVHTGLLQNSTALANDQVTTLLDRVVGERVRSHERPIPYAVAPDQLTGVDCVLPSAAHRDTRVVGTVVGHAAVTGGHIVQGSAYTEVNPARGQRQAWSHYLARPGTLEAIGKMDPADVAEGFLTGRRRTTTLEIGAISGRLLDEIQGAALGGPADRLRRQQRHLHDRVEDRAHPAGPLRRAAHRRPRRAL
jgi:hypothetical protein